MQSILIELIVDYIGSDMSFADFVNHLDWNKNTLSNTTTERTLINLCSTSRAWAHFARYVLRRRIVIFDGLPGLLRLFALIEQEGTSAESTPLRPWVREIYFAGRSGQENDSIKGVSQLLARLFRICPNIEGLFISTAFKDTDFEPFLPVIHSLGDFHHLKALWLRHFPRRPQFVRPNLSEFLVVLPRLRKLNRLYVEGWVPLEFNETINKRKPNAPSHSTDLDFAPPEALKIVSLNKVETFTDDDCDAQAFSWLLSPVDSRKYRPTALAFDIHELRKTISFGNYEEPNSLLACAQDSIASITSLRLSHYYQSDQFALSKVLKECRALESLSIFLRCWSRSEHDSFAAPPGVAANDIDPELLPLPVLPDTVRSVHLHLEYPKEKWDLEDEVERDRLLVAQMRKLPHVKKLVISRPPLVNDDKAITIPLQTLDMTREYCTSEGIEFSVLDYFAPPTF